ncbi:MAG: OmpA family protein [bacterium]
MKRLIIIKCLFLILIFLSTNTNAQLASDSWGFGFGGIYPRLINSAAFRLEDKNYGGFLSIQRNFSEHVSLRIMGSYFSLTTDLSGGASNKSANEVVANSIIGDIDLMYYLVPCEPVSPFFSMGVGYGYTTFDNAPVKEDYNSDYELSMSIGADWDLGDDWRLKTELGYHTMSNNWFEGVPGVSGEGLLGTPEDAYMRFDIGFIYIFEKGQPSKYCQLYTGLITEVPEVDYERIENIVKKHIPREITKEIVVDRPVSEQAKNWVLVGVNFDFNSHRLKTESYPVLFHAVQVLLQNPTMTVEIQGHTDNIGSEQYNQRLSEKRAEAVRNYLVARGIAANRLRTVGFGEKRPLADNNSPEGRSMNRRIEFKVLN